MDSRGDVIRPNSTYRTRSTTGTTQCGADKQQTETVSSEPLLKVDFVTLFPEMIRPSLGHSILARAQRAGLVAFRTANPRDFAYDRHQKVDDSPFGGEPGMLLKPEPVALAIESLGRAERTAIILTDPAGLPFRQCDAAEMAEMEQVVFVCGHYEGIDDRVRQQLCTHAFSIGDYVLTNGEMPALVMADAIVRLRPGVLGNAGSLAADSHSDGLLGAPNYTRPVTWRGETVPEVLRSGDHKAVSKWRREQALRITSQNRPELLSKADLTPADVKHLRQLADSNRER